MVSDRVEAYDQNTKAQFEALGRLVQAFEAMVYEVRASSRELLVGDRHKKVGRLVDVILHHQNLTAKPLLDIYRGLIAEIIADALERKKQTGEATPKPIWLNPSGAPLDITPTDRDTYFAILATIATEYEALYNLRNSLLHATWWIGWSADLSATTFDVQKFAHRKSGMVQVSGLPKSAAELLALEVRCDDVRTWIAYFQECFCYGQPLSETFRREGNDWVVFHYRLREDQKGTLPRKPSAASP
jgi:hypothetical protein